MTVYSIIIATHERPQLLARAIQSVKCQTSGTTQVIVVSDVDCSRTRDVVGGLLTGPDLFVQRFGGARGPAASRNLGMSLVQGDVFAFLDDDDAFGPDYLRHLEGRRPEGCVTFCNHHSVLERFEAGRSEILKIIEYSLKDRSTADLYVKNFIPLHCLAYPRSLLGRVAFDETLAYEDWEFILQAAALMPLRHVDIFGPIVFHRDAVSRSQQCMAELAETYRRVYIRHPSTDPTVQQGRRRVLPDANSIADAAA